ncbi:receptor protein 9DC3 [Trifolium repens]|nr:receptor protein 9DC3 [Trifolium repens]
MSWLLLCLHIFLFQFPSFSSSFNFLCHHDESFALLQFKSSFPLFSNSEFRLDSCANGESYHQKTATWKHGTDCCSWHGVKCNTFSGHVVGLNLGCEGIEGTLHPNSTIFHLTHLQKLNLSHIYFTDSPFHFTFGGFLSLTHLDLSQCYFKGEVPIQISHLSKLESLHLTWNELVWKETTLKRLVQNATYLRELFLDYTDMSLIRPNSIDLIFNQSSSLITLNLQKTFLSGKFNKSILCFPSIQELDMSWNDNLEGQLPQLSCSTSLRILDLSYCLFKEPIPQSFSNLTHLTSLDLSYNDFHGSIPSLLLTLPHLTSLDLSYNDFSGQIPNVFPQSNRFQELYLYNNKIGGLLPTSLSNLQRVILLDLSSNSISGKIPDVFGGMTKLRVIDLGSNNLEGQIPSSLINLTQLIALNCSYNKLEGPLHNEFFDSLLNGTIPPSLLSLPSLVYLDLSHNRFTGHISAISSYSLEVLDLCDNKLQGNLPKSIFNLANLTYLDLSSNNLTGVVDFQYLSKLQNLNTLSLSHNSQLSLKFESDVSYNFSQLWKLDLSSLSLTEFPKSSGTFSKLGSLDLSNNKLSGRVPNWLLKTVDSLTFLNLSQNLFTSINQFSRNNNQLEGLDLSFNLLECDLPVSICNMSSLQILNLAHNKLTGIIPQCLVNLSSLSVLDLQKNRFYGSLPSNFLESSNLRTLNLNGNQLEGHFPKSMSHCKELEFLNLGNNKIGDYFPVWFQTLQYLKVLVLRDNKLHGIIANLNINDPFPSLIIFDISGNNFTGPLPIDYLKKFEAMKSVTESEYMMNSVTVPSSVFTNNLYLAWRGEQPWYYDSVTLATKGNNMTLVKIPTIFVIIDLSRNKFDGEIPNVIGELHALIGLNISHNRLTGPIPHFIGNLTNLEWLDLSSNMLTSQIPAELTNLNFLAFLDLSNNHLVGEIPHGSQFDTFTNDSYEGNTGLCGFPLSKKCGPEPEQHHSPPSANNFSNEEKFEFGWKSVAIGYGCGFLIGIGLGYFVFLIGKPRWLVMIFGGQPKRRVNRRRTRVRRTNGLTMNQMVQLQMS